MQKVLSITEPKGPLLQRLKKADAAQDVIVALRRRPFLISTA